MRKSILGGLVRGARSATIRALARAYVLANARRLGPQSEGPESIKFARVTEPRAGFAKPAGRRRATAESPGVAKASKVVEASSIVAQTATLAGDSELAVVLADSAATTPVAETFAVGQEELGVEAEAERVTVVASRPKKGLHSSSKPGKAAGPGPLEAEPPSTAPRANHKRPGGRQSRGMASAVRQVTERAAGAGEPASTLKEEVALADDSEVAIALADGSKDGEVGAVLKVEERTLQSQTGIQEAVAETAAADKQRAKRGRGAAARHL